MSYFEGIFPLPPLPLPLVFGCMNDVNDLQGFLLKIHYYTNNTHFFMH